MQTNTFKLNTFLLRAVVLHNFMGDVVILGMLLNFEMLQKKQLQKVQSTYLNNANAVNLV